MDRLCYCESLIPTTELLAIYTLEPTLTCVSRQYEWEAFVPPSGFNEPILQYSPGNGKRDVDSEKRKLQGVKFPRMLDAPVTPWKSYRNELKRSYGTTYQEERKAREFIA